jgi:Anti-sigma-K factor rskA
MPEQQPADELDELRSLGRSVGVERVEWETPPPDLWSRIEAETRPGTVEAATLPRPVEAEAPVVSIESRRRTPPVRWVVGAAAVLLVAVAAGAVWTRSASDDVTVLASTELERLGDTGQGSAEIVDRNGALQLRLVASDVEPSDGFTEVWLINPDVTELISLGPIRSDGDYDLPAGLDPAAFPIVDVSFEPFDGNPQHSGDSVLRGQFTF